jgi:hypothetical protein
MPTITATEQSAAGSYIDFGDPAAVRDIGAQTVLVYARPTAAGEGGLGYLISKATTAGTSWSPRMIAQDGSTTKRWTFGSSSSGSNLNPGADARAGSLVYGDWQHAAATWDGGLSGSGVTLYEGLGDLEVSPKYGSYSGSGSINSNAGGVLTLLNRHNRGRAFVGAVAYIAWWNRVLTLSELLVAQAEGPLSVPVGLILCWANGQDYGPHALTPTARTVFVAGALPPNTDLGGGGVELEGDATATVSASAGLANTPADLSGDASASVHATGTLAEQTTVVITDLDAGNGDPSAVVVTDADAQTPTVQLSHRVAAQGDGGWRHFLFAVEGVEGKTPVFRWGAAGHKFGSSGFTSAWAPVYTTDFITWTKASARTIDATWITWSFDDPLPAGTVYVASHPLGQLAHATAFAAHLLTAHAAVASPGAAANAAGVYATSPAETDDLGRAIGGNEQYAIRLQWGGVTTDGHPKRKLVMLAGIHAAGEAHAWVGFVAAVQWMLSDASPEAAAWRANWDVYLYFGLTPNGWKGGDARRNFRSTKDPNRDFRLTGLSTLQEITDLRAAVEADAGSAQVLFSWHGNCNTAARRTVYVMPPDDQAGTRRPIMQAFMDLAASKVGGVFNQVVLTDTTTDMWWGFAKLGAAISLPVELQALGESSQAEAEFVGRAWLETLQALDAAEAFAPAALEGGATGSGSAAGTLSTEIRIAAAALVSASATGSLSTAINLAGSAASATLAAGTLTTQIRLAAAAVAGGQAVGELSGAISLQGAAVTATLASGELTAQIRLDGAALAAAGATGDITTLIVLQGAAVASVLASAALTTAPNGLAGDATAGATAAGALTTAIQMVGGAQVSVIASGAVGTTVSLAGAAVAVVTATGDLVIALELSAAAVAAAVAGADLTTAITLRADAVAGAQAGGVLSGFVYVASQRRTYMARRRVRKAIAGIT